MGAPYIGYGSTGPMLERYLYERGVSRGELSRGTGLSMQTIGRMCAGDRVGRLDNWMRVADFLGCRLSEIIEAGEG